MPEIYVIRPTQQAADVQGLPNAQAIVRDETACGFRGSLHRIRNCQQIVITNGEGFIRIADIISVEPWVKSGGPVRLRRVSVKFNKARKISNPRLMEAIQAITWTQNNIRYI